MNTEMQPQLAMLQQNVRRAIESAPKISNENLAESDRHLLERAIFFFKSELGIKVGSLEIGNGLRRDIKAAILASDTSIPEPVLERVSKRVGQRLSVIATQGLNKKAAETLAEMKQDKLDSLAMKFEALPVGIDVGANQAKIEWNLARNLTRILIRRPNDRDQGLWERALKDFNESSELQRYESATS